MPNYLTETTSEIEYWFIADPSQSKRDELDIHEWPEEQRMPEPRPPPTPASPSATVPAGGSAYGTLPTGTAAAPSAADPDGASQRQRRARPIADFEVRSDRLHSNDSPSDGGL